MNECLLKKLLEVHQIQRHDFMNHLQVISGFLQLGNLDKAKEYSIKAAQSLEFFGKFSKIPWPCLQSYLLWLASEFNNQIIFDLTLIGAGHKWQRQDVDEELTGLLMEIFSLVMESFKSEELKCELGFVDDPLGISLLFVGETNNINSIDDLIKRQNSISKLFSVVCTMKNTSEKLELLISLKNMSEVR